MAWTAPRTWVDAEVVTAALLNTHHRDNLDIVKVTRDAAGRIHGLASAYVADLDSAALTGLVDPADDNDHTGGTTTFGGTSRIVLPVGADKWTGTKGVDARGVWIEGNYIHHIDEDFTTEWRFLASVITIGSPGVVGSAWVEGNNFYYIDGDGDERRVTSAGAGSSHSDASAKEGSAWVETYLHWIIETGATEIIGHADISHQDGVEHSDVPHVDDAYQDHDDNISHEDDYSDSHTDEHTDNHNDQYIDEPPIDFHIDTHQDEYDDVPHQDSHDDTAGYTDHSDVGYDDHSDSHTDHDDVTEQNEPTTV